MDNETDNEPIVIHEKIKNSTLEDKIDECLLEHGILVLHGELTEECCRTLCKQLLYLKLKGHQEIHVILNSIGGEVYHALLVFNTLEALKKEGMKIKVEARGLCASMGVWILMGGTKRVASRYTRFLLHETSSFTYGKVSEMKEGVEELERLNRMLDEILAERTKLTLDLIEKNTRKREWWLSAEEALQYGIIEEIV